MAGLSQEMKFRITPKKKKKPEKFEKHKTKDLAFFARVLTFQTAGDAFSHN